MEFPSNVKYTKEHEWIRVEGDIAYVGITDYAQEQLGDIVFVDITTEGETLEKDEVFGTIDLDFCWVPLEDLKNDVKVYPQELVPYILEPKKEIVHFVSKQI